jgi:hypothetical protein
LRRETGTISLKAALQFAVGGLVAATISGCGGQVTDSFASSVYIQISGADTLQPNSLVSQNGFRVVFLNKDGIAHTITWDSPFILSAIAPAGGRAWFDLPNLIPGTVASYHLDSNGPTGSVTIVGSP